MKNTILLSFVILLLLACGKQPDKKAKLEELRTQESAIKAEIAKLEAEIAKDGGNETKAKQRYVAVSKVAPVIFKTYIDVQGMIDADENIALSTEMPGTISRINVKVGDKVTKGQVLAETDDRAILKGLEEIKTNMELVNNLYEKQKNLWEQKIGTEVQFLQAKSQKESLEKRYASTQEQLRMTRIVSPINGTVDEVNIKVGSGVMPGLPAMRVVNFENLKATAELAETYANKVHKGDDVLIIVPDSKDTICTTVEYASRTINELNRTFKIEAGMEDNENFHPNMIAKMKINNYSSANPVIVVPENTIQTDENGNLFVFINKDKKALKRIIKKGKGYGGMVEILNGLSEKEEIITEGYESLNDGDSLIIK